MCTVHLNILPTNFEKNRRGLESTPPPGPYGTQKKRGPERVNVLKHSEIKILVNHNKKVTLTTFHVFRLIF